MTASSNIFRAVSQYAQIRLARLPLGADCICVICSQRIRRFLPYKGGWAHLPPLMRELDVVGSDVDNHLCPACTSHDRERHLLMYLRASGLLERVRGGRVLHIAPEIHLQRYFRAVDPAIYVLGDLLPNSPEVESINLQSIPYGNCSFDLVVANHVLEHVADDHQALREIVRVLSPNGQAVLQTPYSKRLVQTFEDPGIVSPPARLHAYGQEDHVRLYGQDLISRIQTAGLTGEPISHDALLPTSDAQRYGVNRSEPFMLFRKPLS